jgi:hypothetical protein
MRNEFRIETAALGSFHTITPLTSDAARRLVELARVERARVAPRLGPALVSGALVVEPGDAARIANILSVSI